MDNLEKFIKQNRNEFDTEDPRDELWGEINGELQKSGAHFSRSSGAKMWRAAAVLLLLTTSWLVFDKLSKEHVEAQSTTENGYFSEFQEVEKHYMTLVSEKKKLLEKSAEDDPEYKKEFLKELENLDSQYNGLKENLKFGNPEEIINALIINLQLRVEILNRQLEVIEELNKKEDEDFI